MFKQIKRLFVCMLALIMFCMFISGISAAWADDDDDDDDDTGAVYNSEAAIAKLLKVPHGTDVTGLFFTFNVEETRTFREVVGWRDSNPQDPEVDGIPGTFEITFEAGDTGATGTDGITTIIKETADIFEEAIWPHAGMFVFEITEDAAASYRANTTPPPTEVLTYSPATYILTAYVQEQNDSPGEYYVFAIGDVIEVKDYEEQTKGAKVDPTPGGGGDYEHSQMTFTNTYLKTNGGTDPKVPGHRTLAISKEVGGDYGDKTAYFDFSLTLTVPALVSPIPAFYRAYVLEEVDVSGTPTLSVVTSTSNAAGALIDTDTSGAFIKVSVSVPTVFKLKHGQQLVFIDTPVGTRYTLDETGVAGYTPSVVVTYDGTQKTPGYEGALSGNLSIPQSGYNVHGGNLYVGEGVNRADVTNTRKAVTPTGLNLNDLPFYVMILLALSALAAFIAAKSRKRKRYSS